MSDTKDLVHILKLLDDDSPVVRDRVWEKLETNLPAWEMEVRRHLGDLAPPLRKKLVTLMTDRAKHGFRGSWLNWRKLSDNLEKLEAGLSSLALFLSGGISVQAYPHHPDLAGLLDGLAQDFRDSGAEVGPRALAEFLFLERGICGAEEDYYDPANSDLVQVIARGKGIPITLACLFILVGDRLGLEIAGCDVPEHFLTRAQEKSEEVIIDCFDGGKILDRDRLEQLELKYAPDFFRLVHSTATAEDIIARVLRNLINAFHISGDKTSSDFMWKLAEDLRADRADRADFLV